MEYPVYVLALLIVSNSRSMSHRYLIRNLSSREIGSLELWVASVLLADTASLQLLRRSLDFNHPEQLQH
jgi:hypothetical protein